jgi:sigma-E factor negative regulatory protein RseB
LFASKPMTMWDIKNNGWTPRAVRSVAGLLTLLAMAGSAWAQTQTAPAAVLVPAPAATDVQADVKPAERNVAEWLLRMHEASRRRSYIGTFVVTSAATMSSSRIWHACDGDQQVERVESLTGAPRSTFRRNDEVITFHSESKIALAEKRDAMGMFPNLLKSNNSAIGQFYAARQIGVDRVAGLDADVVQLQPKDNLRFGYRVWSEKKTGLVMKLQTLDTDGRVVEQAAFSELQLDAPVSMRKLTQMMANTEGYKVTRPELVKTTALAEGWSMRTPVAGFAPMSCFKRTVSPAEAPSTESAMQWIFSDGLASVSLFVEAYDRNRHVQEGLVALGATQYLTRRFVDRTNERANEKPLEWWLTVVGEVPRSTLTYFAQGLERKK